MALGDHLFWWDHLMQFNVEFTVEILKGHVDHKMKFKKDKRKHFYFQMMP